MAHKTLLEIIRDEFEDEISQQKILPSDYISEIGQGNISLSERGDWYAKNFADPIHSHTKRSNK